MRNSLVFASALLSMSLVACSDDGIDSNEEARRTYLGLDTSISKSLQLGFDGYNSASSANIAPQTTTGDATGDLTVTGQVAQGSSDNHEMRLYIGMVDYSEGPFTVIVNEGTDDEEEVDVDLTYNTSEVQLDQPYLHLSLRNVPDGDFTGELTGTYSATGDIEADVTLNLTLSGTLEAGTDGVSTVRTIGGTTVTGTATSGDGVYDVNVTL